MDLVLNCVRFCENILVLDFGRYHKCELTWEAFLEIFRPF